jgi:hypothetical protein
MWNDPTVALVPFAARSYGRTRLGTADQDSGAEDEQASNNHLERRRQHRTMTIR